VEATFQQEEPPMKLVLALAAAGIMSMLTAIAPANAQKDSACIEKCNRSNLTAGGGRQSSGTAQAIRGCIAACPKAGTGKAK
jgi:hypothetical protein